MIPPPPLCLSYGYTDVSGSDLDTAGVTRHFLSDIIIEINAENQKGCCDYQQLSDSINISGRFRKKKIHTVGLLLSWWISEGFEA